MDSLGVGKKKLSIWSHEKAGWKGRRKRGMPGEKKVEQRVRRKRTSSSSGEVGGVREGGKPPGKKIESRREGS